MYTETATGLQVWYTGVKFSLSTPQKHTEGAEAQLHLSLKSAVDGGDRLTSLPGQFK